MVAHAEPVVLGADYRPLRDQMRDEIRQRIVDGRYAPGARLVERDLATELKVSRLPIREALRMLGSEGFVAVLPPRGVIVRRLSSEDVDELFDVREALEVLACRRAAERATKSELRHLNQLLQRAHKKIIANDMPAVGEANEAFHDELIRIAHNNLLASILEPLQGRLHWLFRQIDDPEALWTEHSNLLMAIASGDSDVAGEQALRHVRTNRVIALRLLFGSPDEALAVS